jgi:transposase-like protein
MKRVERSFTVRQKREALAVVERVGVAASSRQLGIARPTLYDWKRQAAAIQAFKGHSTSKTLKGQGRKGIFPGVSDLLTYMKDVRREKAVHFLKCSSLFENFL